MDGVITFYSSQQVMKAEKIFNNKKIEVHLIPGPREISPNCGVAICFEFKKKETVSQILNDYKILFEEIHYYPEIKKYSGWLS